MVALLSTITYNALHKRSPLTTYGEAVTILGQNLALVLLIWSFRRTPLLARLLPALLIVGFAAAAWVVPAARPVRARTHSLPHSLVAG